MTQAMRDAHIEPSIIEDLVDFGFDRGFASGIEKGIEQGRIEGMRRALAPLVRLCEKRLGRAMTEPEQARLLAATQGSSDEVADALDKPATELAAWLSQRA